MISDEQRSRLIDRVAKRTKGTKSDPLTRDEIEQVVDVVVEELAAMPPDQEDSMLNAFEDRDDSKLAEHDPATDAEAK